MTTPLVSSISPNRSMIMIMKMIKQENNHYYNGWKMTSVLHNNYYENYILCSQTAYLPFWRKSGLSSLSSFYTTRCTVDEIAKNLAESLEVTPSTFFGVLNSKKILEFFGPPIFVLSKETWLYIVPTCFSNCFPCIHVCLSIDL